GKIDFFNAFISSIIFYPCNKIDSLVTPLCILKVIGIALIHDNINSFNHIEMFEKSRVMSDSFSKSHQTGHQFCSMYNNVRLYATLTFPILYGSSCNPDNVFK
uniref:hypothetical protein n=1 Tax=Algoriphagus sp. TaxID=1872435 RepID=UPI0040474E20